MSREWIAALQPAQPQLLRASNCPASFVEAAVAVLGAGPVAWAGETAQSAVAVVAGAMPDLVVTDGMRRPAEACTIALLATLFADAGADAVSVPAFVLADARDFVHAGAPLDEVLRSIWMSHVHVHRALLAALEHSTEPTVSIGEVRRVTDLSFAFAEVVTERLAREFVAERAAWLDSLPALRRQVVDELLAGRPSPVPDPAQVLGLDLVQHLVAAVVWATPGRASGAGTEPRRTAAAVAAAAGAASVLLVEGPDSSVWLWMSFHRAPSHLADVVRTRVDVPTGTSVALGAARRGPDGFRWSHESAIKVQRIGVRRALDGDERVHCHGELDVQALMSEDVEHARLFVDDCLGALGGGDARAASLRDTLRLYLSTGRSRSAAADLLHVVPNTVAYRIARAEELLGAPLPRDTLRLRLALELHDLVDPTGAGQGPQKLGRTAAQPGRTEPRAGMTQVGQWSG